LSNNQSNSFQVALRFGDYTSTEANC
jgi:hypothetical protein